ncbi:MAG: hypothetical protein HXS48_06600 [Theionarchaea archaeon]|nr:MAG: hypothetical protein AYK19_06850 [Theionarchaea archaeon DG-70-1]MBU7026594.1 hypothetical protein [Theionarchaea archaeon]
MEGLSRSFGLIIAVCMLVFVIAIGMSMVYHSSEMQQNNEGSIFAKGKSIQEIEKEHYEKEAAFQWAGHSILPNGTVSIQVAYTGPTIDKLNESDIEFLINGRRCTWHGQLAKERGSRVISLHDGETLYILVNFDCALWKGDTLTFVYAPLNLEVSAQV